MSQVHSISIVVPSRTGEIQKLRAQLEKQTVQDWELIVNTDPPGPAHARNVGAKRARGRYLVFLDDDIELGSPDLIEKLVRALDALPETSVVGAQDHVCLQATAFQRRLNRQAVHESLPQTESFYMEVPWHGTVNGRCMALRRELFEKLGGFDMRADGAEEPEFLYRVTCAGGKIYFVNGCRVYYDPPKSFGVLMRKTFWYERGNAQIMRLHPESRYRVRVKNFWQAAGYLFLRTLALPFLVFLKASFHFRRPEFCFRPSAALTSYLGAWAYCAARLKGPMASGKGMA